MTAFGEDFRAYAIFCDDIRIEVGGKRSLMGIYSGDMIFPAEATFPLFIPRLVIDVTIVESIKTPMVGTVLKVFNVEQEEGVLCPAMLEVRLPADFPEQDFPPDAEARQMTSPLVLSPYNVPQEGRLRVRLYRGDEVFKVAALRLHKQAS